MACSFAAAVLCRWPLLAQRLVVSNCCVKAKGITSIATECAGLTHLVFAVYKVTELADLRELQVRWRPTCVSDSTRAGGGASAPKLHAAGTSLAIGDLQ